jgi:TraX protein
MSTSPHNQYTAHLVDNADWLKTAAIIAAAVGHFGYFFMDESRWWSVVGRLAAPTFFFRLGYAQSRTVPSNWIWLGVILTVLESWNAGWAWVAPNILLSFALIRMARPYVKRLAQRHGWAAFALLVSALCTVTPVASKIVDYGAEGWLWALFGLYQRMYVDGRPAAGVDGATASSTPLTDAITVNQMRLLACFAAAVVYIWHEQKEFAFPPIHFAAFILGIGVLSPGLCLFRPGPSRIQPPEAIASALRFIGRHTLEIYAIQLAGSELVVKLLPDLVA